MEGSAKATAKIARNNLAQDGELLANEVFIGKQKYMHEIKEKNTKKMMYGMIQDPHVPSLHLCDVQIISIIV